MWVGGFGAWVDTLIGAAVMSGMGSLGEVGKQAFHLPLAQATVVNHPMSPFTLPPSVASSAFSFGDNNT